LIGLRRVSSRARLDFFEHGKNRLVKPAVPSPEAPPEDPKGGSDGGGNGGDGKPPSGVDWAQLPKAGTVWPEQERNLWIERLKGSFKLIYKDARQPVQTNEPVLRWHRGGRSAVQ
jgi:hypothetical protein